MIKSIQFASEYITRYRLIVQRDHRSQQNATATAHGVERIAPQQRRRRRQAPRGRRDTAPVDRDRRATHVRICLCVHLTRARNCRSLTHAHSQTARCESAHRAASPLYGSLVCLVCAVPSVSKLKHALKDASTSDALIAPDSGASARCCVSFVPRATHSHPCSFCHVQSSTASSTSSCGSSCTQSSRATTS